MHFQLVAAAVRIGFSGAPPEAYPRLAMQTTELLSITGQVRTLSFSLSVDEAMDSGAVVVVIGMSFFESLRGEVYPFKGKESFPLGIVEVC